MSLDNRVSHSVGQEALVLLARPARILTMAVAGEAVNEMGARVEVVGRATVPLAAWEQGAALHWARVALHMVIFQLGDCTLDPAVVGGTEMEVMMLVEETAEEVAVFC